jgi:hypothetical protein
MILMPAPSCLSRSYHLQMAFPNCPIAEFLILSPDADRIVPTFGSLFTDEPLPEGGYISLPPDKPGFGVTLNREGIHLERPHPHTPLTFEEAERQKVDRTPDQPEWLRRAAGIPAPPLPEGAKD